MLVLDPATVMELKVAGGGGVLLEDPDEPPPQAAARSAMMRSDPTPMARPIFTRM
jgi:hypothetical protein